MIAIQPACFSLQLPTFMFSCVIQAGNGMHQLTTHLLITFFFLLRPDISSFLRFFVTHRFTLNLCQFPVLPSRRWSSPLAIALSALSWLGLATMISTLWLSVQRWLVRCILQCIRNRGGRLEHTLGHLWELKRDHGHSLTVTLVGSVYCLNNA